EKSFAFSRLRPYFDLRHPEGEVSLNAHRPLLAYRELDEPMPHRMQRSLTAQFRVNLISESGLVEFKGSSPLDVRREFQSREWRRLIDLVSNFGTLSLTMRARVLHLLATLCYYDFAVSLRSAAPISDDGSEAYAAVESQFAI